MTELPVLDVPAIEAARARLDPYIVETPTVRWTSPEVGRRLGPGTDVRLKLELLQVTGTFKPRGALTVMLGLPLDALARGVVAVSAGNHAIATAYAASVLGTTAKVVMMMSASPVRIARAAAYGAKVILAEDVHAAFAEAERIAAAEGRTFVHPYEGPGTALGNATLGLEIVRQTPAIDAVIVPVGGGGLAAGVAAAIKAASPATAVYGVEPEGADSLRRSLDAGRPEAIDKVTTIADSLGAPRALPMSFELCRRFLDDDVLVDDDALRRAMALLFDEAKLAVEPAGAAATAALLGPLRARLAGRRTVVIVCGSNIDLATWHRHVGAAA
ncbi:MAG: pyridoxal-phosphate dependent enzyme [Alphaproteobacteria bacterium]